MQFYIHIWTNLEYFELLNKGFLLSLWKQDKEIIDFFSNNFPWELENNVSSQYEINFISVREIKKRFWNEIFNKISWIYYWSDNCEYLLATKQELEKAIENFKEFNKKYPPHQTRTFTFVTPYIWNAMLDRLEESLEYLNSLKMKNPIEIVVNDLWTLNLINKKYKNLTIIFWRLIHKLLKTPLIDTYWYEVHPSWESIKNKTEFEKNILKEEIIKWQLKFYNSCELNLSFYQNFLLRHNIKWVAIDYMEKRIDLYKSIIKSDFIIDLYYPWAIIFTWRLCDTSAIENPDRWMYATDEICPRTCNRYDIFYKIKTVGYNMLQRWNAWYRSEINLEYLDDTFINNPKTRFVFSPFIPV